MYKIKIGGIVNDSVVDGPGIRLTIFMQGCKKRCCGCHNPQLQNFEDGEYFTIQEIFNIAKSNPLLDGITFSGGEPFCQAQNLFYLAKMFKDNKYHLAIYSGYTFEEIINNEKFLPLLKLTDTLVDGPFILEKKNLQLKFCGSENQRIIDVQQSLQKDKIILDKNWY
jgi:anaerobic ribonucleoside-triphosphate reductase activating protein